MISIQTPTGKKGLTPRGVMNAAGVKKAFAKVSIKTTTANKVLFDATTYSELAVVIDPAAVFGGAANSNPITITTAQATATATGMVGEVTWSWALVSGSGGWAVVSPTSNKTAFRRTSTTVIEGQQDAVFEVTATDSVGQTDTDTVEATVWNYGGYL